MSEHTPGPWTCEPNDSHQFDIRGDYWEVATAHGFCGANGGPPTSMTESIANARLIAAAPDLLDAIKQIVSDTDSPGQFGMALEAAHAAIAKATGKKGG
jgi:hypothetical protein